MLMLVLGGSLLLLFIGWEGVGLCSYLLIGFWYDRQRQRPAAAKKAFVVNRVGDFGSHRDVHFCFGVRFRT